jgi:hypothetical protein
MGGCDIAIPHNIQVVDFLADWAFIAIKPIQESIPQRSRSGVSERRYKVEINNVGRIK